MIHNGATIVLDQPEIHMLHDVTYIDGPAEFAYR